MEYFKEEIFEMLNLGGEKGQSEYEKVYHEYLKENRKALRKLPKTFVKIYESIGFHDAIIPEININTKFQGFNRDKHGNRTSLELVMINYDNETNGWRGWRIVLENIRNLTITAKGEGKSLTCIETFHHDELLLTKDMFLSWEINAIQAHLKIEFKTLKISDLMRF